MVASTLWYFVLKRKRYYKRVYITILLENKSMESYFLEENVIVDKGTMQILSAFICGGSMFYIKNKNWAHFFESSITPNDNGCMN
jgi:hypothetical protein